MHFVHYNTKCGRTLGEALANCGTDPTALAVLGKDFFLSLNDLPFSCTHFINHIWILGVMIEEGHENSAYDNILDGKYKHFLQISVW